MKNNIMTFSGLKHKRVLITGASGGIGSCLAQLFAAQGAHVGLHYHRNRQRAEFLQRQILARGGKAQTFQANLLSQASVHRLITAFVAHFRGIDVLVNNAGAPLEPTLFLNLKERTWEDTFSLNAKAPFFLSCLAFDHMKKTGGRIINISSISAKVGGSETTLHYAAAKAALEALTLGFARAGAKYRILVNTVRAGVIDTPAHLKMKRPDFPQRIRKIPLGHMGQPEDVAQAVLFLASKAGNFITGEVLTVSGGE